MVGVRTIVERSELGGRAGVDDAGLIKGGNGGK